MEQMMMGLYEAAVKGSVISLLDLVKKDALILERCTVITSYGETPLHIAAMLGHTNFCSELVSRNPRLVREVDFCRSTALHVASIKGHVEIVIVLVSVSPQMCLWYDGDGLNPIHIAAMKGRVDVLEELVKANPDGVGARARTCQGGTALHLCVQYYQIEALKYLAEFQKKEELLNAKDDNGNSILHLSVGGKQVEIVEYLVSRTSIDVDALNLNGLTASNILALQSRRDYKCMEIAHLLQPLSSQQFQQPDAISRASSSPISGGNTCESWFKTGKNQAVWLEKQQNSILVVASLIATMAFQASVNLPNFVMETKSINNIFAASNTIGFLSCFSVILLLISGLPLRRRAFMWTWMVTMWFSIAATTCTFAIALSLTPNLSDHYHIYIFAISAWYDLMALLFVLNTIRFLSHRIRDLPLKIRIFMWIFMILVFITASVRHFPPVPVFNPFDDSIIFSGIVSGWVALVTILVVLYAIQFAFFIIKKLKRWFKGFRSHLGDHSIYNFV